MARKPSAGKTHKAVAEEAGFMRVSPISVLAGTVTGYGSFAVLAAIIGAAFSAADADTDFRTNDWAGTEALAGTATAVTLLVAYLFGGYVAGRMARRSGALHGVVVFALGLLGGVLVGGLVAGLGDDQNVEQNLRSIGVPTSGDEWGNVGTGTAIAAILLMAVGAVLGGVLGERWHTKLARRAASPDYGPEARARRQVVAAEGEREARIESDDLVRRDRDDLAAQAEAEERRHEQELEEERELERERELALAVEAEREREKDPEEARAAERELQDERIRDLDRDDDRDTDGHDADDRDTDGHDADDRDTDGHRVVDVRGDDRIVDTDDRQVDVRDDDPDLVPAGGTTPGVRSSGIDDEPRYTAAEWAEVQRSEDAGRGDRS